MRQLKALMKAKKPMWRCGECKCITLQCWRENDEFCNCGESVTPPTPPTPTTYTVTITSNDTDMWNVDIEELIVEEGTSVTTNDNVLTIDTVDVTAIAEAWYSFSNWSDSDWNDLPETITWDITIVANFNV